MKAWIFEQYSYRRIPVLRCSIEQLVTACSIAARALACSFDVWYIARRDLPRDLCPRYVQRCEVSRNVTRVRLKSTGKHDA